VDSIGFGVTPDPDVIGRLETGLPDVQRSLNWVHLASRYPVRVRVQNPTPDLFRIGESAVVTIRGTDDGHHRPQSTGSSRRLAWFGEFLKGNLPHIREEQH